MLAIGFFLNTETGTSFTLSRKLTGRNASKKNREPANIAGYLCNEAGSMSAESLDTMLLVENDQVVGFYHGDTMPEGFGG